jgi:hypothetical protein
LLYLRDKQAEPLLVCLKLELEVKELMGKADKVDSTPLEEALSIPAEIARRQELTLHWPIREPTLALEPVDVLPQASHNQQIVLGEH